jgi:hypothetical protein
LKDELDVIGELISMAVEVHKMVKMELIKKRL